MTLSQVDEVPWDLLQSLNVSFSNILLLHPSFSLQDEGFFFLLFFLKPALIGL